MDHAPRRDGEADLPGGVRDEVGDGTDEMAEGGNVGRQRAGGFGQLGERVAHLGAEGEAEALGVVHGEEDIGHALRPETLGRIGVRCISLGKGAVEVGEGVVSEGAGEVGLVLEVMVGRGRADAGAAGEIAEVTR